MKFINQLAAVCFLIALIACGTNFGIALAASSPSLTLDAGQVQWKRLSFFAKKRFQVEVSTRIELTSLPSPQAEAALLTPNQGNPVKPDSARVSQMAIDTIIDPIFRSPVHIQNRIWFNPRDAAALGRVRLRRGEDDFKKIYRFTEQGVFRHRIEPGGKKEASLEPEQWTDVKDSFYPYDMNRLQCASVTEPSLLIYILSAAATSQLNKGLSLCVFGKRQLHHIQIQKEGQYSLDVNYLVEKDREKVLKQDRIKACKYTITSEPLQSRLDKDENFSFLGFHQEITIYVEPTSGMPVQASGLIPGLGKAQLKLQNVLMKQPVN